MKKGFSPNFFYNTPEHKNDILFFLHHWRGYFAKCLLYLQIILQGNNRCKEAVEDLHDLYIKTILNNGVDPIYFLAIALDCLGIFKSKFRKKKLGLFWLRIKLRHILIININGLLYVTSLKEERFLLIFFLKY